MKPPPPFVSSSSQSLKRLLMLMWVALPCAASCTEAGRDGVLGPDPARAPEASTAGSANTSASGPPAGPSAPPAKAASAPAGPAVVETLPVPGDLPASIVKSAEGRPPRIVFLPGVCSNAGAYLWGFAEAARAHGGAIAIDGDRPCGASQDFRSITSNPEHEEPRIQAALAAAGHATPASADVILVGYAVATMSCSLDVPQRMQGAMRMLAGAGIRSSYFEMPGCTHGNLAEGDRVFSEVFTWLTR